MSLIYSKEEISQDLSFKLNKKLLAFDFVSIDKGEVDSRIASIFPVLWSYNGNIGTITEIPIEVCSYEKHFPERQYGQHFNTINISDFLCLSNDNIDLSLVFNKSNWSGSYIILYTRTCTNTTENNNHCYPQEEIENFMKNGSYYFAYLMENIKVDHYNNSNPIILSSYFQQIKLSYSKTSPNVAYPRIKTFV